MTKPPSQLYRVKQAEVEHHLNRAIQKGCMKSNGGPVVFFRADDIGISEHQWYWHQHGYVHRNFESKGKNQEFGPARSYSEVLKSIQSGKQRLDSLLGKLNQPVFTPPWNRCSEATLKSLEALGFNAISRSRGARPETQKDFPDFQVNVDLHTRKEQQAEQGFHNLLEELERSLAGGNCGIMLHHQRMNKRAIDFLDTLLKCLKKQPSISFVHFGDLII